MHLKIDFFFNYVLCLIMLLVKVGMSLAIFHLHSSLIVLQLLSTEASSNTPKKYFTTFPFSSLDSSLPRRNPCCFLGKRRSDTETTGHHTIELRQLQNSDPSSLSQ